MLVEQEEGRDLHQLVHHGRNEEDDERGIGRQAFHEAPHSLLHPFERNEPYEDGDDRVQMIPKPGKAKEDQRDERPHDTAETMHGS